MLDAVLEVDAIRRLYSGGRRGDLDSAVYPSDNCEGQVVLDYDIDTVRYQGQQVDFVDTDDACDYLEFLWREAGHSD